jgi:hypothetical protein
MVLIKSVNVRVTMKSTVGFQCDIAMTANRWRPMAMSLWHVLCIESLAVSAGPLFVFDFEELIMLWMLLPPNANTGRSLQAPTLPPGGTWWATLRAIWTRRFG